MLVVSDIDVSFVPVVSGVVCLVVGAVFKYDTVHGVYDGTVENDDSHLIVDGKKIKVKKSQQLVPAPHARPSHTRA